MNSGHDSYLRPRVAGGFVLIALVAVLMVWDAMSPDFSLDTGQLALLLGTTLAFWAVEGLRSVIRGD